MVASLLALERKVVKLVKTSLLEVVLGERALEVVGLRSRKDSVALAGQLKVRGKHRLHLKAPRALGSCQVCQVDS